MSYNFPLKILGIIFFITSIQLRLVIFLKAFGS